MKRLRWDKGSDGSVISNVGLPPSSCRKRSSKRRTAKLRKNCDAHTYKRRPVNSMDPLLPRRARFQSVSSFPSHSSFSSRAIRGVYKVPQRTYVCISQCACTCASTGTDFCAKANEMSKQGNWDSIISRMSWISDSIDIQTENDAPIQNL